MTGVKLHSGGEGKGNKEGWGIVGIVISLSLGRGGWGV